MRDWASGKHEEHWQLICGRRLAKGFLKKTAKKKAAELLSLSRNRLTILSGLLTGHCHLKGQLFRK
jgi:hypothetical protein